MLSGVRLKFSASIGAGGFPEREDNHKIIMNTKTIIAAVLIGMPVVGVMAQDAGQRPPGGPGGQARQRPVPAIIAALDANGDGEIDATEIQNAVAVLKKLDADKNGKLTPEEFMGARPGRGPGRGPGQGGPGQGDDQGQRRRRPAN